MRWHTTRLILSHGGSCNTSVRKTASSSRLVSSPAPERKEREISLALRSFVNLKGREGREGGREGREGREGGRGGMESIPIPAVLHPAVFPPRIQPNRVGGVVWS